MDTEHRAPGDAPAEDIGDAPATGDVPDEAPAPEDATGDAPGSAGPSPAEPRTPLRARIGAWARFLLGRAAVALVLAAGLVLVSGAGPLLRDAADPGPGVLGAIVLTEPAPLMYPWYAVVLAHALLLCLLPRGPWPVFVFAAAVVVTALAWLSVPAPDPVALPPEPSGGAADLAAALFGTDAPPAAQEVTAGSLARIVFGVLVLSAAVMIARDVRAPRPDRAPGPPRRTTGTLVAAGVCALLALVALVWTAALLYTLATGDPSLREGRLGAFVEPDTLAPGRGWAERSAAALTLVALPLLYAGVQGARTLLRRT
ncbi:hypothetical protein IDM40_02150 [Nocardiopsis sp. HNM0947]|uniref:Integral membrane protein n=1 Tax=Nocardiopsis coralli TaxID=2772213 RepID=A0ABR9P115_9ACTN|nr:hypothetical protein [Nocardiopsis coralli]MBE2997508.1 hypothetical protein [Nocardiopsis coralli]